MSGRSTLSRLESGGRNVPRVHLRGTAHVPPGERTDSRYTVGEEIRAAQDSVLLRSRDTDLGREVGMKVLREDTAGAPEVLARLIEEARVTGRLQHPGVLPVYELGLMPDGRPFFTMKLPRGETLEEILASGSGDQVDRRRLLGIFEQVCQTIAYAHSRGVVHGTLSAERAIVGPFGEVVVTEWGPESAGDKRSDLRPLGEILLRILKGERDAEGLSTVEAESELVDLCRRCLAEEFPDAEAVAAEIAGHLATLDESAHRNEVRAIEERAAAERSRERSEAAQEVASAQRRARRQIIAVAGAALLVLLVAGGSWWSIDIGRRLRASRASRLVEAALRDGARLTGEGELRKSMDAAERASVLASSDAVGDELRRRAATRLDSARSALAASIVAAEREKVIRRLPARLREIRIRRGIDPPKVTAEAYERAFREYGIDLNAGSAARIRSDPLSRVLIDALRDWSRLPAEVADLGKLRKIAAATGGDGVNPASTADLRARWWKSPGDIELNLELAEHLLRTTPTGTREALRHVTVATALVPNSAGLWVRMGDACRRTGDGTRAAQAYRTAADLDPDWDAPRRRLR